MIVKDHWRITTAAIQLEMERIAGLLEKSERFRRRTAEAQARRAAEDVADATARVVNAGEAAAKDAAADCAGASEVDATEPSNVQVLPLPAACAEQCG